MKTTDRLSYSARAKLAQNSVAKKLFDLIEQKQTNLALSADVIKCSELLKLADQCGPDICVLKTHIDILEDFTPDIINQLLKITDRHQFLILEDRKFADIGNTVQQQYQHGIYKIVEWADLVTAHSLPGPGCLQALQDIGLKFNRGILLLAEMSSADNLADPEYCQATIKMAQQFPEFVTGFIAQRKISTNPAHIHFTPGVQINNRSDNLGQQYNTPENVITQKGSDIIIVGRGIIAAENPAAMAKKYREIAWQAYQHTLKYSA